MAGLPSNLMTVFCCEGGFFHVDSLLCSRACRSFSCGHLFGLVLFSTLCLLISFVISFLSKRISGSAG